MNPIEKKVFKAIFLMRRRAKLWSVLLGTATFFLLLFVLVQPLQPIGYRLMNWQANLDGKWQDITLPTIEMMAQDRKPLELRTTFAAVDADTLVVPRQSGNAIMVWLNGRRIYYAGDPTQPTANLWNAVQVIPLLDPLQETNTLEIRLTSSFFASGLNAVPYLCPYGSALERATFLNWMYNDLMMMGAGAALFIGVLLIILAFMRRTAWSPDFLLGLALLFSVLYSQDSVFRLSTGNLTQFLWVEKIFIISGYLASLFFQCSIEKDYWGRLRYGGVLAVLSGISGLVIAAVPDLYSLTVLINFTNAALFINLAVVIGMIFSQRKSPAWMLFPATMLLLSVMQMVVAIPLGITWPLLTPYVILITAVLAGAQQILEFNHLFHENKYLHREKNLDPLTGAMNRRFLTEMPVDAGQVLVMIDLDRFKDYNDNFGHSYGDQLLVQFAELARKNLRQNDRIVRLGGDEFVLVLENVSSSAGGREKVQRIMRRIQNDFRGLHPGMNLEFSYGIASVEGSIDHTIERADRQMYRMKEEKRSQEKARQEGS